MQNKTNTDITQLLPPGEDIVREYGDLVQDITRRMEKLQGGALANTLQCKAGCSSCCIRFSVFALEAALILHAKKQTILHQLNPELCPFLKENICSIYGIRPIICRTQGMPLGYLDGESDMVEVSACHLNFQEDYIFTEEELLFMDEYNSRLFELNRRYCEANEIDLFHRFDLSQLLPK